MPDWYKTKEEVDKDNSIKEQNQINQKARKYLSDTDWYLIRKQETGKDIPSEVLKEREAARARIKDVEKNQV